MSLDLIAALLATLNADAAVCDVRIGVFWTAVVVEQPSTGRQCGLASTAGAGQGEAGHHGAPLVRSAGRLLANSALELAALARSDSQLERAIGLAAINALLPRDERAWVELNAEQIIHQRGAGKNVVVVGHFPFIERLRPHLEQPSVLELHPRCPADLPASLAPQVIPQADIVAITAATLVNGTFDSLIALCRPDAFVLLLGPTTPLSPLLFDHGIDVVSGAIVDDVDLVLSAVSQGANFRQISGRRLVTMYRPA